MEYHVNRLLNRLRPAFGLLRRGNGGTLSAKVSKDIENGLPNLMQHPSQNNRTGAGENAPQSQGTGDLEVNHEEPVDLSATNDEPHEHQVMPEDLPQPQFTEGPSRFVLAKDGARDCLALLVNKELLAQLSDLFQEVRDLRMLDRPLYHAKMDLRSIEHSVEEGHTALETAESEEEADNYRRILEQQTSELHKIRHFKDELENKRGIVDGKLQLSRSQTQWILETAMREADLLGPEKPPPTVLIREEPEDKEEDNVLAESSVPVESPVASTAPNHAEVEISEEELRRREVYEEFIERSRHLDIVQQKFDSQGILYEENLAEYQEMVAAGTISISRSDFDRRKVRYGQQLTRALIDAEDDFEESREHAHALGAIVSDYGQGFFYGAEYAESWPENQIAEYIASQDWSFVEDWMDNIPHSTNQADFESVEIDEWDAEEVDVNDSISVMDCEDYRQDIDRYQRLCARLEDPCPEVRWLGQPDARVLERRSSC